MPTNQSVPPDAFLAAVRAMRRHQRAFFAAAAGTPAKHIALGQSRHYERLVDEMLNNQPSPDPIDLFYTDREDANV